MRDGIKRVCVSDGIVVWIPLISDSKGWLHHTKAAMLTELEEMKPWRGPSLVPSLSTPDFPPSGFWVILTETQRDTSTVFKSDAEAEGTKLAWIPEHMQTCMYVHTVMNSQKYVWDLSFTIIRFTCICAHPISVLL